MNENEKIVEITHLIASNYPTIRKYFRALVSLEGLPITTTQLACLVSVKHNPQITMSALAKQMYMSNQQLTKVIDNLVHFGLIERIHDENNRRQIFVDVTAKGLKVLLDLKTEIQLKLNVALKIHFSAQEIDKILESAIFLNQCIEKVNKASKE
ncbi:MAG: MarR family transcriptional regulator [Clostridia bacterium]|nr:MarR family transcriptional regulator [Clostridia bacterium]